MLGPKKSQRRDLFFQKILNERRNNETDKDLENSAKTFDNVRKRSKNVPRMIQSGLKIARKCAEICTFSDGRIASDCFEIFGLVWNLIL